MLAKAIRFITEPIRVITLYSAPLSAALFTTTKAARTFSSSPQVYITYVFISRLSPLSQTADYTLLAKSDMASFVDSLVAPLSVINALIVAIGMRKQNEISDTFNKLEAIWDEYQVYEKLDNE